MLNKLCEEREQEACMQGQNNGQFELRDAFVDTGPPLHSFYS